MLNTGFYRSNDGGRTFTGIPVPHGDNHDLWIAPDDPQRMIDSNDGGANVSFNGGRSWTEQDQPTAQFYRVALDNDFPLSHLRSAAGQLDRAHRQSHDRSLASPPAIGSTWAVVSPAGLRLHQRIPKLFSPDRTAG